MGGLDPEATSQMAGFGSFTPLDNFETFYNNVGDEDEEYVSDDEFQKGLTD